LGALYVHEDFKIIATIANTYKAADGRPFIKGIASNHRRLWCRLP